GWTIKPNERWQISANFAEAAETRGPDRARSAVCGGNQAERLLKWSEAAVRSREILAWGNAPRPYWLFCTWARRAPRSRCSYAERRSASRPAAALLTIT